MGDFDFNLLPLNGVNLDLCGLMVASNYFPAAGTPI